MAACVRLTFVLLCRRATTECFAIMPVIDWNQNKQHFLSSSILVALAFAYSLHTLAAMWKLRCCMKRGYKEKHGKSSSSFFNNALPQVTKSALPAVHSQTARIRLW